LKSCIQRKDSSVLIAKTGNKLCPVTWLSRYLEAAKLTPGSEEFLFTSVQFCRKSETYQASKDGRIFSLNTRFLNLISANSLHLKNPEKPIKHKMQIRKSETFCKFL
jgi:hypothetical protein